MDASFCIGALDDALIQTIPEILNTDQGSQFTSEAFADRVLGWVRAWRSRWTAEAGSATTSSSNGCAGR